jgi:glycine/D-amino acid oxidase-like deaminating enzyme|eukprot:CAMPEP_0202496178 /NCGR_PEP_ID=MMETSP1361-20130828/19157_1 /ASSEMBLY_ACC=CAM_ASM_000849 /TAXON_ID=210615 /ORGANISM="Staurosira complex sp., Strain CCMP2646" /LENGTH=168 /DNA_ID=CAMNT_0049127437 /DNA_START=354 /DNA_END=863 /DNA_ORIENTATION=-
MVDRLLKKSMERGVEVIENTVTAISRHGDTITSLNLASGNVITVGAVVNAAGTRASSVAALANIKLDIRPRRRYTFVFTAKEPLDRDLPLTIDPTGVHFRQYGYDKYLVGCPPLGDDKTVNADDFSAENDIWEKIVHPILSHRITQFKELRSSTFGWSTMTLMRLTAM